MEKIDDHHCSQIKEIFSLIMRSNCYDAVFDGTDKCHSIFRIPHDLCTININCWQHTCNYIFIEYHHHVDHKVVEFELTVDYENAVDKSLAEFRNETPSTEAKVHYRKGKGKQFPIKQFNVEPLRRHLNQLIEDLNIPECDHE